METGSWAISYRAGHFTCLAMRNRSHCTQRIACLLHQSSAMLPGTTTQRGQGPPSSSGELNLKTRAKMSKSLHLCFERRPQLSILNQEVPHSAQIYSIKEPFFVTLSPSSGYLSISTWTVGHWTNTPTKNHRPLLSNITYHHCDISDVKNTKVQIWQRFLNCHVTKDFGYFFKPIK